MKKILYIIPIFLLFFITSEIYGFTYTDYDGTVVESQFDPYEYINEYSYYIIDVFCMNSSQTGVRFVYDFYFFETKPEFVGTMSWNGEPGGGFWYRIIKDPTCDSRIL